MLTLVRNEQRMEYNEYEIALNNDYIQTLIDDVSAAFELEEGELELTEQDIANIWMNYTQEYLADHVLMVPHVQKSVWSTSTYEQSIFDYIHDYLNEDMYNRDPWTYNSEVCGYEDEVEER